MLITLLKLKIMKADTTEKRHIDERINLLQKNPFSFKVRKLSKGDEVIFNGFNENHIFFVFKGELHIRAADQTEKTFRKRHMYFMSKDTVNCRIRAMEDTLYIAYNSDNMLPSMNQEKFYNRITTIIPEEENMEELKINQAIQIFLTSIIYYSKKGKNSGFINDLKKEEFLYILRISYKEEELTRFFSPFKQQHSPFRKLIFSKYTYGDTVASLAGKCFMSTKTLNRKFKSDFATTPLKWIMQQKAKEIKHYLIQNRDTNLHETARIFHFSSTSELSHFLKTYQIDLLSQKELF